MRNVSSGTIDYYAEDMLGSSRTIVQAGQTSPCYDADFYPFGGERDVVATCSQNYKFEGKERDTETGNDDFGARYYNSRLGRWLSSDWSSVPAPVPYANLTNPQTLNLYAIVSDDPESFADLDGHDREVSPAVVQPEGTSTDQACGAQCAPEIAAKVKCDEDPTGCAIAKDEQQQAQTADPSWYSKNVPFCICDDSQNQQPSQASAGALALGAGASKAVGGLSADALVTLSVVARYVSAAAAAADFLLDAPSTAPASIDESPMKREGSGPKAADAPGVTAGGQATDEHGNKLGPSKKPQLNETNSNTREGARNRALNEGSTAVEHSNPKKGNPHFHAGDAEGNKKPTSTHHNYPED